MSDLQADARHAMLTRLAGDINVLAHTDHMTWTCCHQGFEHDGVCWTWRFCNGGMPGEPFATEPCGHWHHRWEPPLLALAAQPGT